MNRNQPLSGITVIEFGQVIAAPFAGALLSDFGAEVIKIETSKGDSMRVIGPRSGKTSAWWKSISRGKRLLSIDWKAPQSREIIRRLVSKSHVLIENFRPGVIEKNGFGPEILLSWNPDLIILRISGFGQTGPYSSRPGFGKIAEAFSGISDLTGYPGGPPTNPGFPLADTTTGLMGAFGVVMSLYAATRGFSKGQVIDLPIYEAPLRLAEFPVPMRTGTGAYPTRNGNRQVLSFALAGTYRSLDEKWVTYSAANFNVARRVLALFAGDEFAAQSRFDAFESICAIDDEIDALAQDWMADRTAAEAVKAFLTAQAAAGIVYDVDDILADPHIKDRRNIVSFEGDSHQVINAVPRLSSTPGSVKWLGRDDIGADTRYVLEKIAQCSEEEVEHLFAQRVVFGPSDPCPQTVSSPLKKVSP